MTAFPDLKHNDATSAVTLGLLSYITPITPIGIDTFDIITEAQAVLQRLFRFGRPDGASSTNGPAFNAILVKI